MEQQAKDAYRDARAFYKGEFKAGNKSYNQPVNDKQKTRNTLQPQADTLIASGRATFAKGKSPGELGKFLFENNKTAGNCGEMACVAMYIAHNKYNVEKARLFSCTYTSSRYCGKIQFGHSMALLKGDGGDNWLVDPWAGICCKATDYNQQFIAKMKQWLADGKRISLPSLLGGTYWAEPTETLILDVVAKGAKFGRLGYDEKE